MVDADAPRNGLEMEEQHQSCGDEWMGTKERLDLVVVGLDATLLVGYYMGTTRQVLNDKQNLSTTRGQ